MTSFSRSPEKKKIAILEASVVVVAEEGINASTKKIAKLAGVSEGTIFTHYHNKFTLLNQLYLCIKANCADDLKKQTKAELSFSQAYWSWSINHLKEIRALEKIEIADALEEKTKSIALSYFENNPDPQTAFFHEMLIGFVHNAVLKFSLTSLSEQDRMNCQDTARSMFKNILHSLDKNKDIHIKAPLQDVFYA